MGRIRYKYSFERAPAAEDLADCFQELTGLALFVERFGDGEWELSARPLRGSAEISREGNILWVVPEPSQWIASSYFIWALVRVLHRLGVQRPAPRIPRYATRRWAELSTWRQWLHG
jgi:hypothetical protein